MSFSVCIQAWLSQGPLGLRSRVLEKLGAGPVLAYPVACALALPGAADVCVITEASSKARVDAALSALEASHPAKDRLRVLGVDAPEPAFVRAKRRSRRFTAAHWRGGLGNAFVWHEEDRPAAWKAALEATQSDAALVISGSAPLMSASWLELLIDRFHRRPEGLDMLFTQAPPGLHAAMYTRDCVDKQARHQRHAVEALELDAALSRGEPEVGGLLVTASLAVTSCRQRLMADTERGARLCAYTLEALDGAPHQASIEALVAAAERGARELAWEAPRRVIIEPTTRCNQRCAYCPQPTMAREAADLPPQALDSLAPVLAAWDDCTLTFGGFGEPLLHPALDSMIRRARELGAAAIHVETNGLLLDGARFEALARAGTDLISVSLDAVTEPTYRSLRGEGAFSTLRHNLEALAKRVAGDESAPMIVPELVKQPENVAEMADFLRWAYANFGAATIKGHDDFSARLKARNPLPLRPMTRASCRRLVEHRFLSAHGLWLRCERDFEAEMPLCALDEPDFPVRLRDRVRAMFERHEAGLYPDRCASCAAWDDVS